MVFHTIRFFLSKLSIIELLLTFNHKRIVKHNFACQLINDESDFATFYSNDVTLLFNVYN